MAWGFVIGIITLPYQWVRNWRERRRNDNDDPLAPEKETPCEDPHGPSLP
jgi:hypothetical protein